MVREEGNVAEQSTFCNLKERERESRGGRKKKIIKRQM